MSQEGEENQGTGLRDVFEILVKEPKERLQSLTILLGESPEDNIIHALCLIILQREVQALNKLQTLKDNYLANHVAERWQMSGGKLEDFRVRCGQSQEFTGESLAALARIFKVLTERRLCEPHLRNLAYQRALSTDSQKTSNCEDLEYDQLREEAKVVCGPQVEEWFSSPVDLKSGSYHDLNSSMEDIRLTFRITDESERGNNLPSPLQASSSMPSYPTHLEISIPPTVSYQGDKVTPETSDKSKSGQSQRSEEPQPKSNEPALPEAKKDSKTECRTLEETPNQTTKPFTEPKFALPTATMASKVSVPKEMHESKGAEEEEEEIFYAFVILHAPEDGDMAERIKERLESVTCCDGATFADDFAIPGKSTLKSVEDAINNSAFTLLLLTCNFNTRMEEVEADSALINSINKKYKHNTVVPLLPRENCMPKQNIPMILRTINPLEENKHFDKKAKQVLSPANIKRQKRFWTEGQRVKRQIETQDELKQLNQNQKLLIQETKLVQSLVRETQSLLLAQKCLLGPSVPPGQDGGEGGAGWQQQQQPNINIAHAKYIMIGSGSQMTVDHSGGPDKDEEQ
ncbi:TIR domain-containing adapter molecule 1 [Lates calcarifer]|uniref:TIR domain-containing adapter molecule 1 n=1 Tax=Lates calcarifer TaxID=8187 RepID=A0A4W6E8G6_LATCA|nr:TIR domain-containing adapter molecule 1 [Lates calcarifer]XP_018532365.1 TIR domain-containing adapter molecule 1 [Lates calcarifer]